MYRRSLKKIAAAILSLLICFSVWGCGQSEAAAAVDSLILEIGEVSLESEQKITTAEEAAEKLSQEDYRQLKQLALLEEARATYDRLVEEQHIAEIQAAAKEVEAVIQGIGEVSLEKESQVTAARTQYNQASQEVRDAVENYDVLEQAEKQLSSLKIQKVIGLIDEIGEVSLESKEKIETAYTQYNALTNTEKGQVTNYGMLTAAKDKLTQLENAEKERILQEALKPLQEDYDKVQGYTWYHAAAEPQYIDTRSYVLPYIGVEKTGEAHLILRFNYTGDEWVFFEKIIVVIDGETYQYSPRYFDIIRDNQYRAVWETLDIGAGTTEIEMLNKIAESKETIIRFQGDSRVYDLTVSASDKTAIKQVLDAYDALKNSR